MSARWEIRWWICMKNHFTTEWKTSYFFSSFLFCSCLRKPENKRTAIRIQFEKENEEKDSRATDLQGALDHEFNIRYPGAIINGKTYTSKVLKE